MQFFDDLVSGFQCHMIKAFERFEKESGNVSFGVIMAACVLGAVALLTVFVFWNILRDWLGSMFTCRDMGGGRNIH